MLTSQLAGFADWQKIHSLNSKEEEEEFFIFEHCGRSPSINISLGIPEYQKWLEGPDEDYREFKKAYLVHRQYLQHLQWQAKNGNKRWILKMPFHLLALDALFEMYPDATIIFLHRNPLDILQSWLNLVGRVRNFIVQESDILAVGTDGLNLMKQMINKSIEFRESNPTLANRFIDISYDQLTEDLENTLQHLFHFLHMSDGWTKEYQNEVKLYLAKHSGPQKIQTADRKLSLEQFGLCQSTLEKVFSNYLQSPFTPQKVKDAFNNIKLF